MFEHLCPETHAKLIDGKCPWCGKHIRWGRTDASTEDEPLAIPPVTPQQRGKDLFGQIEITPEMAARGTKLAVPIQRGSTVQTLIIAIPAGIRDGTKLRLRGVGVPGPKGGSPGDLYLSVSIRKPNP